MCNLQYSLVQFDVQSTVQCRCWGRVVPPDGQPGDGRGGAADDAAQPLPPGGCQPSSHGQGQGQGAQGGGGKLWGREGGGQGALCTGNIEYVFAKGMDIKDFVEIVILRYDH